MEKLLREAQAMMQDENIQIEIARKYVTNQPSLYEQILRDKLDSDENEKMFAIGKEALDAMPGSYVVRSEIALLTAEYACKMQNRGAVEDCWIEAFRFNATVVNYLRLRMQIVNWVKHKNNVRTIYERAYREAIEKKEKIRRGNIGYDASGQEENKLDKNEYCRILFFDERFDEAIGIGMKEKDALGWSFTFMKQGLALFLLLRYSAHDSEKLPVGLMAMLDDVFDICDSAAEKYFKGINVRNGMGDYDVAWKMFCEWKKNVQVSEGLRNEWLDMIDEWIEHRVAGIMENNRRKYYGECASYIAALGEVQESAGDKGAKARIMERYRDEYYRRWAFHQELGGYGMGEE